MIVRAREFGELGWISNISMSATASAYETKLAASRIPELLKSYNDLYAQWRDGAITLPGTSQDITQALSELHNRLAKLWCDAYGDGIGTYPCSMTPSIVLLPPAAPPPPPTAVVPRRLVALLDYPSVDTFSGRFTMDGSYVAYRTSDSTVLPLDPRTATAIPRLQTWLSGANKYCCSAVLPAISNWTSHANNSSKAGDAGGYQEGVRLTGMFTDTLKKLIPKIAEAKRILAEAKMSQFSPMAPCECDTKSLPVLMPFQPPPPPPTPPDPLEQALATVRLQLEREPEPVPVATVASPGVLATLASAVTSLWSPAPAPAPAPAPVAPAAMVPAKVVSVAPPAPPAPPASVALVAPAPAPAPVAPAAMVPAKVVSVAPAPETVENAPRTPPLSLLPEAASAPSMMAVKPVGNLSTWSKWSWRMPLIAGLMVIGFAVYNRRRRQ